MKLTHIIAAASSLLMLPVFSTAQTVIWQLNEDFSEAAQATSPVRPTPGPTTWFFQGTTISAFDDVGNTMTLGMNTTNAATKTHVAYFSNGTGAYASTPMPTMQVGDTVSLQFTALINDDQTAGLMNADGGWRWGLFNARGNYVAADYTNATLGLSSGNQYTGYAAMLNLNPSSSGTEVFLRQRLSNASAYTLLDSAGTTIYTTLGNSGAGGTISYSAGSTYTFYLTLSLTDANTMSVSYSSSLNPTGLTVTQDITGLSDLTSFNTFGFEVKNSGGASSYTLSNLSITMTQVPEPSAYAALAGLAVLGFAYIRRRRS